MLHLQKLKPLGRNQFSSPEAGTVYEFHNVLSKNMALRAITAVDMMYVYGTGGNALTTLLNGIRSRTGRRVRFFSDGKMAVHGTEVPLPSKGEAGGFSVWRAVGEPPKGWCSQVLPISKRADERICLYESSQYDFGRVVSSTWHELTHIFTPLYHNEWDPKTKSFAVPDTPRQMEWTAQMAALEACAPTKYVDPVTDKAVNVRTGGWWVKNLAPRKTELMA